MLRPATKRERWTGLALLGAILVLAAYLFGCASAIGAATRTANAATVVLVEGRPLVAEGIERDVAKGATARELEADWRPIVTTFDRLVDTTLALRQAIKTARAAERAGQDPATANLLILGAEASHAIAALLAAFPELADMVESE